MQSENNQIETLNYILKNSLHPEVLDSHPWTKSLVVREAAQDNPHLQTKSAGQQLVIAIASQFTRMMPSTPPQGSADSHWGAFGVLAAQYFAPLVFGSPAPKNLQDSQRYVNESILLFAFGKQSKTLSSKEKETYKLIGAHSSLNGKMDEWHEKGVKRLAEILSTREAYLAENWFAPAVIPVEERSAPQMEESAEKETKKARRRTLLIIGALLAILIAFAGFKAVRIYSLANLVRQDAEYIQKLAAEDTPRLGRLKNTGSAVSILRRDFIKLKNEAEIFLWMGPFLKWMPIYGNDLASIQDLAALGESLLESADLSYQAIAPIVEENELSSVNPVELANFLKEIQPQMEKAQQSLLNASATRGRIPAGMLSPVLSDLLLNKVDPVMRVMQDALAVAVEFPRMMGATEEGGKTYLLLVQNEDELRPTGGFISAASLVRLEDGNFGNMSFVNSGDLDNLDMIYPATPWQLAEYMNSPILIFRDANWHTNYPTTAAYAKHLYSYVDDQPINGVIAFDQQVLVELLRATGPITLPNAPYPIDAGNIVGYMRESKTPTAEESAAPNWNNKEFLNDITRALLDKVLSGEMPWELVSTVFVQMLNERHILIQTDNAPMNLLLDRYGWDGALSPRQTGDYLMVVDANIGFNKTNAVVETSLAYDVDLVNLAAPVSTLTVIHKNNAQNVYICKHWLKDKKKEESGYPISDCYWNYLRVYTPSGTRLINATPQSVPDNWMINKQKNPGQVNALKEEGISNAEIFGTLQVIPAGESLATSFEFALPASVLRKNSKQITYHIKIQKQPGTLAHPLTLRVHLAKDANLEQATLGSAIQDHSILYETNLRTDVEFEVVFSVP
jgi:hypothetical protein